MIEITCFREFENFWKDLAIIKYAMDYRKMHDCFYHNIYALS